MLSSGTTTSLTRPGSQYAASSRMMTSPETPFNDCGGRGSGREHQLLLPAEHGEEEEAHALPPLAYHVWF